MGSRIGEPSSFSKFPKFLGGKNMKIVHIYDNIINCEEIRDIRRIHTMVRIFFKKTSDYVDIVCESVQDAKDVMDVIYDEMIRE